MSDLAKLEVEIDLGHRQGQLYGGIVKRAKYLNTDNIERVWSLVDQLAREQHEVRKNA